jgi:hypothetical protein
MLTSLVWCRASSPLLCINGRGAEREAAHRQANQIASPACGFVLTRFVSTQSRDASESSGTRRATSSVVVDVAAVDNGSGDFPSEERDREAADEVVERVRVSILRRAAVNAVRPRRSVSA